ncbi:hypothetical protein [Shewanella subflava]|uniref:DUF1579 domain-containing protein n=1 Tax=Shewanella subflava TaxID=2986476 RepID=A0ABT3I7Z8_9GAMM|nr:hypothetical protein [Shewanella subflava]MCW3172085.1 hypothetical protein [Shewanella subflava]
MILNCFKVRFLAVIVLLVTLPISAMAAKVPLDVVCAALIGEWQGSAANPKGISKQVTSSIMCSADGRNMYISVSQGARFVNSETWWFRQRGSDIELVYSDGIKADIYQSLTLYQQVGGFAFLGEGEIKQRPALIRLSFEALSVGKQAQWLWQQSAHFLDDDSDNYQVVRGISLMPIESQCLAK